MFFFCFVQILVACTILIQNIGGEVFTFTCIYLFICLKSYYLILTWYSQRQRVSFLFLFLSLNMFYWEDILLSFCIAKEVSIEG